MGAIIGSIIEEIKDREQYTEKFSTCLVVYQRRD
jgi:hypothetical protein